MAVETRHPARQAPRSAWTRLAAGFGLTALAILLAAAPWPFALAALAPPAVAHAVVFDCSLRRPDALPAPLAFIIGLLLDVLSGSVFGLGAVTCLAAHGSAAAQRRFLSPRGIGHAWIGLALTAVAIAGIGWTIASAYSVLLQPVGPSLAQAALTVALYPPLAILLQTARLACGLTLRKA